MRKTVRLAVLSLSAILALSPLAAETGDFAGYRDYSDEPVATDVALDPGLLAWLAGARATLAPGGSTFLSRMDAAHWMGLALEGGSLVLRIHDESARYNFRALVGQRSGRLTVLAGVDRYGTGREADATAAAKAALGYLERLRKGSAVFAPPASVTASAGTAPGTAAAGKAASVTAPARTTAAPTRPSSEDAPPKTAPATAPSPTPAAAGHRGPAPKDAMRDLLLEGNARYVAGKPGHPAQDAARRTETAKAQSPFAVVVTCSDSRVPPEIIFDRGLGELFVVRSAGEVLDAVGLGSVEYAVEHLGVDYILVLGHERCGAVDATMKGGKLPPDIEAIAELVRPAVLKAEEKGGDVLDGAIRQNAVDVMAAIAATDIVREAVHARGLVLAAAYYDLDTGKVEMIK